ncbi:MAG: TVP38/TMEM64 family protein [Desulfobacterales bacterium]
MISFPINRRLVFSIATILTALAAGCVLAYLFSAARVDIPEIVQEITALLKKPSAPGFFIAAMIVLPPFGFPLSFFLALAGIRFGIVDGMILTFFVLPVHMTICYVLARTFLRGPLTRFLKRRGYHPPLLKTRRPGLAMFGFLLMPGPPYALKTYLLAMTRIPYHRFLVFNWFTESLITLPIVAMTGAAAEKNWILFGAALLIFALSLGLRWHEKRKKQKETPA